MPVVEFIKDFPFRREGVLEVYPANISLDVPADVASDARRKGYLKEDVKPDGARLNKKR